jgi:Tfp pilus assembly protein PilF
MRTFQTSHLSGARFLFRCTVVIAFTLVALASSVRATPYVPSADSTPLERLASNKSSNRERQIDTSLRAMLARDPNKVELAMRAAQRYLNRARTESDPRLLGQAQAALAKWWELAEPPTSVLLIRATIRQTNHDFLNARRDLEQLVKREPENAQAWLKLATVEQVSGDLNAAMQSCKAIETRAAPLIVTTCMAAINGARGQARNAYDTLNSQTANTNFSTAPMGVRTWALTLQAELAERVGQAGDAERLYRASLSLDPADAYTISMYSDFLIDARRYDEVLSLIPGTTRADILLLRRAIATKYAATSDASQVATDLSRRFAASAARGDRLHLREESRFALVIKNQPIEALKLALDNWRVQKEPLDARIVLEAANAAKQPTAVAEVLTWLEANPLQGAKLAELVQQARAAS